MRLLTKATYFNRANSRSPTAVYVLRLFISFILLVFLADFLWMSLQNPAEDQEDATTNAWERRVSYLLNNQLPLSADISEEKRQQLQTQLSQQLGLGLVLEPLIEGATSNLQELQNGGQTVRIAGDYYWLQRFYKNGWQIMLGPLEGAELAEKNRWVGTGLFYICVMLFIWLWLRPLLKGLDHLTLATRSFAADYQQPLPSLTVPAPITELADSFESMSLRIRDLIDTQKELSGGISHELRTPLARMKFALASVRKNSLSDKAVAQLNSIAQDVDELESLVSTMLEYSRLEQVGQLAAFETLDTQSLVQDILDKYKWKFADKISIKLQIATPLITANNSLITLALSNLIANASRYAKSQIQVCVSEHEDNFFLVVEDDGKGLDENQYQQLVKPFQKLSSGEPQEQSKHQGFGLGLAIVSRVATLHGGKLTLAASYLGGLKASVSWPVS